MKYKIVVVDYDDHIFVRIVVLLVGWVMEWCCYLDAGNNDLIMVIRLMAMMMLMTSNNYLPTCAGALPDLCPRFSGCSQTRRRSACQNLKLFLQLSQKQSCQQQITIIQPTKKYQVAQNPVSTRCRWRSQDARPKCVTEVPSCSQGPIPEERQVS